MNPCLVPWRYKECLGSLLAIKPERMLDTLVLTTYPDFKQANKKMAYRTSFAPIYANTSRPLPCPILSVIHHARLLTAWARTLKVILCHPSEMSGEMGCTQKIAAELASAKLSTTCGSNAPRVSGVTVMLLVFSTDNSSNVVMSDMPQMRYRLSILGLLRR